MIKLCVDGSCSIETLDRLALAGAPSGICPATGEPVARAEPPGTTGPQPQTSGVLRPRNCRRNRSPALPQQPPNSQGDQEAQRMMQQMMQYFFRQGQIVAAAREILL